MLGSGCLVQGAYEVVDLGPSFLGRVEYVRQCFQSLRGVVAGQTAVHDIEPSTAVWAIQGVSVAHQTKTKGIPTVLKGSLECKSVKDLSRVLKQRVSK
jgi:hypothetical protein